MYVSSVRTKNILMILLKKVTYGDIYSIMEHFLGKCLIGICIFLVFLEIYSFFYEHNSRLKTFCFHSAKYIFAYGVDPYMKLGICKKLVCLFV